MKNITLFSFLFLIFTLTTYGQVQVHGVNSSGGPVAKFESTSGYPQVDLDVNGLTKANLRMELDTTENVVLENQVVGGKLQLKTSSGFATLNPTSANGVYFGINTKSPIAPLTVNAPLGGGVADFRSLTSKESWAQFSVMPDGNSSVRDMGYIGVVDNLPGIDHPYDLSIGTTKGNSIGSILMTTHGEVRLSMDSTGYVHLRRPDILNNPIGTALRVDGQINVDGQYTLPDVDGTDGQVLTTDGAGSVAWGDGTSNEYHFNTWDNITINGSSTQSFLLYTENYLHGTKLNAGQGPVMAGDFEYLFVQTNIPEKTIIEIEACITIIDNPADMITSFIDQTRIIKNEGDGTSLVLYDNDTNQTTNGCFSYTLPASPFHYADGAISVGFEVQLGQADQILLHSIKLTTE